MQVQLLQSSKNRLVLCIAHVGNNCSIQFAHLSCSTKPEEESLDKMGGCQEKKIGISVFNDYGIMY